MTDGDSQASSAARAATSPPPGALAGVRPASTVVIARARPDRAIEIFMVRRARESPFMPSSLVFPGGRVDEADGAIDDDLAWERAARRECVEEAALVLGERPLVWFDTWMTPSVEPRRYLARFFLARLSGDEGALARADGHETHAGRWASAQEHLAAWDRGEVDLPPPTLATLMQLSGLASDALDRLAHDDLRAPILPKVELAPGGPFIVMPHDPGYDALPGEGRPAPARARLHPQRFVRDGNRWRPWVGSSP